MASSAAREEEAQRARHAYPGTRPDGKPWSRETVRFARWCAKYLVHTRGPWAGQPLILELWQLVYVEGLFQKRADGRWRWRESLLFVPRKNGKTSLCAALILYALCVWGQFYPRARIYTIANSLDQAKETVFDEVQAFAKASRIAPFLEIPERGKFIRDPSTDAIFRVLPADRPGNIHGLNPILVVQDEVHEAKSDKAYWALRSAGGANPGKFMMVAISTAGEDKDSLLGMLYLLAKRNEQLKALGQPLEDPLLHAVLYEVKDEDAQSPEDWGYANPASWIEDTWLVEEYNSYAAKGKLPELERLQANRWVRSEDMLLPAGVYDKLIDDLADFPKGSRIFVGVDLGKNIDTTGVAACAPMIPANAPEDYKPTDFKVGLEMSWGIHNDPKKPRPLAHKVFTKEKKIPIREPMDYIRQLCRDYDVVEVAYDPWRFALAAEQLEEEGIPMVEFRQGHDEMIPATENMLELVYEQHLHVPEDPILKGHFESATVRQVSNKGRRLDKDKARHPMDLCQAATIALSRAMADEGTGTNIWTPADFERMREERDKREDADYERAKEEAEKKGEPPPEPPKKRLPEPPGRRIIYV